MISPAGDWLYTLSMSTVTFAASASFCSEKSDQLFRRWSPLSERHGLPLMVMVVWWALRTVTTSCSCSAGHAGGAGVSTRIMRYPPAFRPAADLVDAHRVYGYGGGFAIDGQGHGFARGERDSASVWASAAGPGDYAERVSVKLRGPRRAVPYSSC